MRKFLLAVSISLCFCLASFAQPDHWQQRVKYTIDVVVETSTNRFTGKEKLEYSNNSPEVLDKVFYHLYWNAFQPNSNMDVRSRELGKTLLNGTRPDWDNRVRDRISKLSETEIGYQKIISLKMNGVPQPFKYHETILEVDLTKPIPAKGKAIFEMEFEAQVPIQIRRSGRDNAEGVKYSMSQWYPKMCEYDIEGWHPTPYIAREFYGVWGDYEVNISIDKAYTIAASGYLQNPQQIGHGYETPGSKVTYGSGDRLTWKFVAPNVHDFVWAADPNYIHHSKLVRDGMVMHAFYKIDKQKLGLQFSQMSAGQKRNYDNDENNFIANYKSEWEDVLELAAKALPFMDKTFGKYPYKQYSFIQGGDGGMEYPMATLLKGAGRGVVIHEWMHSWYQGMMGTNESLYPWMDEGFTSYADDRTQKFLDGDTARFPYEGAYRSYINLARSAYDEPLTTHSDQYATNYAYSTNAYSKGEVFMSQLGYIVGEPVLDKILLQYYESWRFKHPNANDFVRVAENVSGLQLDWYRTFFVNTSKKIDYKIDSLWEENGISKIRLKRIGEMPMPIDLQLTFKDGTVETHNIPLDIMFGNKSAETKDQQFIVHPEWEWTHPYYIVDFKHKLTDLKIAEIDPGKRMADIDRKNNQIELNW
ncbi:MAG: M1 family metallopeptidase [Ferruginibacter sp.]